MSPFLAATLALLPAAADVPAEVTAVPAAAPASAPDRGVLLLGLGGFVGSVPDADGTLDVISSGELRLGLSLGEHLTVGLRDLGYAQASLPGGDRHAITGGPFAELGLDFGPLQPYAGGSIALQQRFGGDFEPALGASPGLFAGLRFWCTDFLAVGLETRASYVVSDAWVVTDAVLPQGAIPWTAGTTLDFHLL